MQYLIGLVIATLALWGSIHELQQGLGSYWDVVAFIMVLGGTVAVAVITTPWELRDELKSAMKKLFLKIPDDRKKFLSDCLMVIEHAVDRKKIPQLTGDSLGVRIVNEGVEMIELGMSKDSIHTILDERVYQHGERARSIFNMIKGLAKYPPAFGLAGTVLGLVHLMRGVSEGLGSDEIGVRMAIALVATFYGLLVANLVINPAGESIQKISETEAKEAEIAVQAVMLAAERVSLLESQELLNSFVSDRYRVNLIEQMSNEAV